MKGTFFVFLALFASTAIGEVDPPKGPFCCLMQCHFTPEGANIPKLLCAQANSAGDNCAFSNQCLTRNMIPTPNYQWYRIGETQTEFECSKLCEAVDGQTCGGWDPATFATPPPSWIANGVSKSCSAIPL